MKLLVILAVVTTMSVSAVFGELRYPRATLAYRHDHSSIIIMSFLSILDIIIFLKMIFFNISACLLGQSRIIRDEPLNYSSTNWPANYPDGISCLLFVTVFGEYVSSYFVY